ncbi:MAG TPA: ABC transporter permease subunit [Coriobacteriia bacterium]
MRWDRAWAIASKDMRETFSTAQLVVPLIVVPIVVVIGYPTLFLLALRLTPGAASGLQGFIGGFPPSAIPDIPGLTSAGRAAYIATVYLFAGFFLLVPVMVSTVVAANSFAGEKERRTLEGLLYTPVSDSELVVGKIVAAFLPTVVFTWVCFAIYTTIVALLGIPVVGQPFFPTANWWALMVLLVPAVSLLVISIVVLVSAKARGFQEANAIGGSVILPVIGLAAAQTSGLMVLSAGVVAVVAVLFAVADVGLLSLIVRAFKRSRIVSYLP